MYRWFAPFALALIACSPQSEVELVDVVDLDGVMQLDELAVTGVSVDPADGSAVLSTLRSGVFRLLDGELSSIVSAEELQAAFLPSSVTDVAVMPGGKIAMTVPGIGLLYDEATGEVSQHFCYEPGWGDWEVQRQETHSLAYDANTGTLISQPQTFTGEQVDRADIAVFHEVTGEPLAWHTLADADFLSRALTIGPDSVLLGSGAELHDYAMGDDRPAKRTDLSELGVGFISGLAIDGEDLLVVDGVTNELLTLRGW